MSTMNYFVPPPRNASAYIGASRTHTSFDEKVRYHLDPVEFDFHIDATTDADSIILAAAIARVRSFGYELIPEDECPAEDLGDGWIRIYLVPIETVCDMKLDNELAVLGDVIFGVGPRARAICR